MPKLLSLNGEFADLPGGPRPARHHRLPPPAGDDAPMVRHERADALPELVDAEDWVPGCGKGVRLTVDHPLEERYLAAERIAIEFPAFNDGRGLSLAVLLRTRHGYGGDIMATGDVHEDMLHYLRRCGFTSFLVPDDRNFETALSTLAPYSDYYQASVIEPEPAFRRIGRGA